MAVTRTSPGIPTARTVRAVRREFERAHTPRARREGTVAVILLGGYLGAGLLWWWATRPATVLTESPLVSAGEWSAAWAWVVLTAATGMMLQCAQLLGPVSVGAERAQWELSTPVDRGALLRPRVLAVLAAGAAVGAVVGRLAAFAGAVVYWGPLTAAGAGIGVGAVAVAVLVQGRVLPPRTVLVLTVVGAAASASALLAAVAGTAVPVVATGLHAGMLCLPGAALAVVAILFCGRITVCDTTSGSSMTAAAGAVAATRSASILAGVLEDRAWRRVAGCPSRRLPASRMRALVATDVLRHVRRPSSVSTAAGVVPVAWALSFVLSPLAAAWVYLAVVATVALLFSTGLRDIVAHRGLRPLLGMADREVRRAVCVVPAVAAVVAAVAAVPLAGGSPIVAAVAVVGGCAGVYRLRTRPEFDEGGLVLVTAVGQIPVDLIRQWLRGPDVLVAAVLVLAVL